jgi:hypothetical protein
LDRLDDARCQTRVLLRLLHKARTSRFGLDHDFGRIRTVEDFRRLVPLSPRGDLGRSSTGATGPALQTALAHVVHARPRARLLSGAILVLGSDALPVRGLPCCLLPYTEAVRGTPGEYRQLAERAAGMDVTCLIGPPKWLTSLIEQVRQVTGRECPGEVWPGLTAVIAFTGADSPSTADLRRQLGSSILVLDVALCPEGAVAVEDPRHGALRLLPDHGVFFEFVPLASSSTERFGIGQIEAGRPYELVLTSQAAVWACRTGRVVVFKATTPPLLSFVETVPQLAETPKTDAPRPGEAVPSPFTAPACRPQSGGTPGVPPGTFARSPWSIPVGRG